MNKKVSNLDELFGYLRPFSRCPRHLRTDPAVRAVFEDALSNRSLPCVKLFGIGMKEEIGAAERKAVSYLNELFEVLRREGRIEPSLTVYLCDTHAVLNGVPERYRVAYARSATELLEGVGYDVRLLSEIHNSAGIDLKTVCEEAGNLSLREAVPDAVWQMLANSARRRYHGPGTPEFGAACYFLNQRYESRALQQLHRGQLFLTYFDPRLQRLLPDLATFHMYTTGRGHTDRPWFTGEITSFASN